MLISKGFIKFAVKHLQILSFLGSNIYFIDPLTYKMEVDKSKKIKVKSFIRNFVALLVICPLLGQIIKFGGVFPRVLQYEGFFYFIFLFLFLSILFVSFTKATEARKLFNSLLEIDQQLNQGNIYFFLRFQFKISTFPNIQL